MSALIKQVIPFHLISALDDEYLNKRATLKDVSKGPAGISIVQLDVAKTSFAVEVGVAVETILYRKPQALPRSQAWALGVIELRGEVVPIIDLAILNNQTASAIDKNSRLMIVRHEQLVFGLLVSNVSAVSSVPKIHEGSHNELSEFGWQKTTTRQWVDIHGKKIHFFDLKNLLNQADFLTLTY
jgi:chemotaxis signal transduction protein